MLTIYLSVLDTEQERKKMTDLYEEHKYVLLRYAIKITGSQSMAEDAVHNTFISIIENISLIIIKLPFSKVIKHQVNL